MTTATLESVQRLIADEMRAVDEVIRTRLHSEVVLVRQVAEYIVGGGGKRGAATGLVALGGSGTASGDGGAVTLTNAASVTTNGQGARAISAGSQGGGGGEGGGAGGILSIGGQAGGGGNGGDAQTASYTDNGAYAYQIITSGDRARGVFVQSVGGGGGDSGNAISASSSPAFDITILDVMHAQWRAVNGILLH